MSEKFQNNYRVPSARLQHWDYRWAAAYFITICTQDREHFFGEIRNGKMILSGAGILADVFWHEIKHHAINIELGEFVVMPNHVHGILILNGSPNGGDNEKTNENDNADDDATVETRHALSLQSPPKSNPQSPQSPQPPKTIGQQRFQNQGKNSVSSIIGSYKSAVTRHAN